MDDTSETPAGWFEASGGVPRILVSRPEADPRRKTELKPCAPVASSSPVGMRRRALRLRIRSTGIRERSRSGRAIRSSGNGGRGSGQSARRALGRFGRWHHR